MVLSENAVLSELPASLWVEEIPAGLLTDDIVRQAPTPVISSVEVLPTALPDAWQGHLTTALAISVTLSRKVGQILPWRQVRDAIDGAYRALYLETAVDSATWLCEFPGAQAIKLRVAGINPLPPPAPLKTGARIAEADLCPNEIQDLVDMVGEQAAAAAGYDLKFHLQIELGGITAPAAAMVEKVNGILEAACEKLRFSSHSQ